MVNIQHQQGLKLMVCFYNRYCASMAKKHPKGSRTPKTNDKHHEGSFLLSGKKCGNFY